MIWKKVFGIFTTTITMIDHKGEDVILKTNAEGAPQASETAIPTD